jgi:aminoglycoside phosphotransferase (APT) family kinase protein
MLTITLPFSIHTLQGAVRRHLARPTLAIDRIVPEKLNGGVSGSPVYRLQVSYRTEAGDHSVPGSDPMLNLVLKRGRSYTGAILAGSARREASFYRSLAHQLPVRTPRLLLTADDLADERSQPLVLSAPYSIATQWDGTVECDNDWVLMKALPSEMVWPRASWTAEHYRLSLDALADLHATWWGSPPDPSDYPWVWMPTGHHTEGLIRDARAALVEIESAPWGHRFYSRQRLHAWLRVLDDPTCLLDVLVKMPQTLIHGDYWPGNIAMREDGPAVFDWQMVGVGPAPYDLSCFHSSSRWWFGRIPLSLIEIRSHYLERLNDKLGQRVDRYIFDIGMDAARAWRFAVLWPTVILEHHVGLLANLTHMRATAIEPAFASLRRCIGYVGD